jgi:hypothetical protein
VRHADVGDDEVGRATQHEVAGGDRVLRDIHLVPGGAQVQAQQLADTFVVVNDQDGCGH